MSLDASVDFNRDVAQIAEQHCAAVQRRDHVLRALEDMEAEIAELERALDTACARYVDRFDRNGDGKVTPIEVLKTVFSDMLPSWTFGDRLSPSSPPPDPSHIVRAMFAIGADGDTVVDLAEFTRAVRAHVLGPDPDPDQAQQEEEQTHA